MAEKVIKHRMDLTHNEINYSLEEFYNDLSNDPDFIAYQHQKYLEWMRHMNEHYENEVSGTQCSPTFQSETKED
jgi:DNA-directed RNA polymerase delta subunit